MADHQNLTAGEFDDGNDGSSEMLLPPSPTLVPASQYSQAMLPQDQKNELDSAPRNNVALPPLNIGAVELLTFFPNHTQWPDVLLRLKKHGWTNAEIARVQLFARGYGESGQIRRRENALRHQIMAAGKDRIDATFAESRHRAEMNALVITADASTYRPLAHVKIGQHPKLVTLAEGVVNWPSLGHDRSLLTKAVMWAVQNDAAGQYSTHDIQTLAVQHHWHESSDAVAGNTEAWDVKAKIRVLARMVALGYHDP